MLNMFKAPPQEGDRGRSALKSILRIFLKLRIKNFTMFRLFIWTDFVCVYVHQDIDQ